MTTSTNLTELLIAKYGDKFVCVPECNIGSAWMLKQNRRMDLWAMAKSWTKAKVMAFEIKTNRGDFLRDDKWPAYLDYCNEFYFVAPTGVIDREEVPSEAGLLIASKNARILYTKKKAPFRNVQIPEAIFRYILMWRTVIVGNANKDRSKVDYWKQWLREKDEKKELGYNVSTSLRRLVDERIEKVSNENKRLKEINDKLQIAQETIDLLGIDINHIRKWSTAPDAVIRKKIEEINSGLQINFLTMLMNASNTLKAAHDILTNNLGEHPDG